MTNEKLERMENFIIGSKGNISHVRRVLHISKLLAEKESIPYDEDALIFAAYFHDIAAYPPYAPSGAFDHALESGRLVPDMARDFGYDDDSINVIVEAVKYHDKAGMGRHNETRLIRNADGVDYLGFIAVARDFVKFPDNMRKAIETLKRRKDQFYSIIDLEYAKELAGPRVMELESFISRFEEESFGIY